MHTNGLWCTVASGTPVRASGCPRLTAVRNVPRGLRGDAPLGVVAQVALTCGRTSLTRSHANAALAREVMTKPGTAKILYMPVDSAALLASVDSR